MPPGWKPGRSLTAGADWARFATALAISEVLMLPHRGVSRCPGHDGPSNSGGLSNHDNARFDCGGLSNHNGETYSAPRSGAVGHAAASTALRSQNLEVTAPHHRSSVQTPLQVPPKQFSHGLPTASPRGPESQHRRRRRASTPARARRTRARRARREGTNRGPRMRPARTVTANASFRLQDPTHSGRVQEMRCPSRAW